MPRVPQISPGSASRGGSVGRQRVDAPAEAFGSGRGLQQAGAGAASFGAGISRVAAEAEREQKADENRQTNIEIKKARLQYLSEMNAFAETSKDATNSSELAESYQKYKTEAKTKAVNSVRDPLAKEMFSLDIDESELSYNTSMAKRYRRMESHEIDVADSAAVNAEINNLVISSDQLVGFNYDLERWAEDHAQGFKKAINRRASRLPEADRDNYRKSKTREAFMAIINNLNQRIMTTVGGEDSGLTPFNPAAPESVAEGTKNIIESMAGSGLITDQEKDKAIDLTNNSLASRKKQDDNIRVNRANQWSSQGSSAILDLADNLPEQQRVMKMAEAQKGLYATKSDPTGSKAFQKIKNTFKTFKNRANSINALGVSETLYSMGPEEARVHLEKLEASGGVDALQSKRLRATIGKQFTADIKQSLKQVATNLKKMAEDGNLYSASLELGAREFEPLELEAGEKPGVTDLLVPVASDWNREQIDGQGFTDFMQTIESWAQANEVKDPAVVMKYANELLFPVTERMARLKFRARQRVERKKPDRLQILNKVTK